MASSVKTISVCLGDLVKTPTMNDFYWTVMLGSKNPIVENPPANTRSWLEFIGGESNVALWHGLVREHVIKEYYS